MTHMLEEIRQQPDVVRRIIDEEFHRVEALAQKSSGARSPMPMSPRGARRTTPPCTASTCSKSSTACPSPWPRRPSSRSTRPYPHLGENALVLGISQSGAAPDVIEVVKRAREIGGADGLHHQRT